MNSTNPSVYHVTYLKKAKQVVAVSGEESKVNGSPHLFVEKFDFEDYQLETYKYYEVTSPI